MVEQAHRRTRAQQQNDRRQPNGARPEVGACSSGRAGVQIAIIVHVLLQVHHHQRLRARGRDHVQVLRPATRNTTDKMIECNSAKGHLHTTGTRISVGDMHCNRGCEAMTVGWKCCTCAHKPFTGIYSESSKMVVHADAFGNMHGFCGTCLVEGESRDSSMISKMTHMDNSMSSLMRPTSRFKDDLSIALDDDPYDMVISKRVKPVLASIDTDDAVVDVPPNFNAKSKIIGLMMEMTAINKRIGTRGDVLPVAGPGVITTWVPDATLL